MLLTFVIPCYGSQDSVEGVVNEIESVMKTRQKFAYEIILVNDCSPDNVYEELVALSNRGEYIKVINLAKNFGQHSALMAGYNFANGEIIISIDDDGQIPVEDTFKLVDKINEGYDAVYAQYPSSERGVFRTLGSKVNDIMAAKLLSKPKGVQLTSFYAARKFVIKEMLNYNNPYPYLGGLVCRTTKKIGAANVLLRPRATGSSGYSFGKLISLWLNGFTAFSIKPLRVASIVGVVIAIMGAMFGVYTVINWFLTPNLPMGYSSLMAVLLVVGGVMMCMLGLIGEYIGRIYISLNNAPQFVVREKINIDEAKERDCEGTSDNSSI